MLTIMGTYENGVIKLEKEPEDEGFSKVMVTFLEDEKKRKNQNSEAPKRLKLQDFHFAQSREALKNIKGSLSDTLIEERRSYL